jgi:hypothetical protein
MGRVTGEDQLARMFWDDDVEAVIELARNRPGRVVRFLTGRLYAADQNEKWRAVGMFGALAGQPGLLTDARLLDLLQRFLWALNDESGAVPFGVPEAIGEILAARPEHRASLLPILCGMLTNAETFQTGPVERGLYWALGRIGPDVCHYCPAVPGVVAAAARSHPDAETRATAAAAFAQLGVPATPGVDTQRKVEEEMP